MACMAKHGLDASRGTDKDDGRGCGKEPWRVKRGLRTHGEGHRVHRDGQDTWVHGGVCEGGRRAWVRRVEGAGCVQKGPGARILRAV